MGIDAIRRKLFDVLHVREKCEMLQQRMALKWNLSSEKNGNNMCK